MNHHIIAFKGSWVLAQVRNSNTLDHFHQVGFKNKEFKYSTRGK